MFKNQGRFEDQATTRLTRLPEHVDIVPVVVRIEQNLILSTIKKHLDLESIKQVNQHLEQSGLAFLQKRPHLVTFNTGKCLFWLFLTKRNNRQCAFLIDKQLSHMWLIKSQFASDYYRGTLFEVNVFQINNEVLNPDLTMLEEYLKMSQQSNRHLLILIQDVILCRGKTLLSMRLNSRYSSIIETFQSSQYQFQINDLFEFNFKPYFTYEHIESAWYDYRPRVNYLSEIQGILFRSIEPTSITNYWYNVNPNLKRPNRCVEIAHKEKSINLLVKKTNNLDNYQLYALDRDGNYKYIDIALINDLRTSKMLQQSLESAREKIFVCEFDDYFQKWKPLEPSQSEKPDVVLNFTEKLIDAVT
jgi:hypothetical protein